jgi:hypothetical protein
VTSHAAEFSRTLSRSRTLAGSASENAPGPSCAAVADSATWAAIASRGRAAAQVRERLRWIVEEHHAELAEHHIKGAVTKVVYLGIRLLKAGIGPR